MTNHKFLLSFLIPATLCFSTNSFAESDPICTSDADCAVGDICEKEQWVDGCNPDQGPCDDTVHTAETGWCFTPPTECSSDADCGEYLSCESSDPGVCWASSDGTSGCEEPDPNAPQTCQVTITTCTQDSDCPREFECEVSLACPDIACAEGEDCSNSCDSSAGECVPKQMDCDSDSECPTDWSCMEFVEDDGCPTADDGGVDEEPADSTDSTDVDVAIPEPAGDSEAAPEPLPEPIDDSCGEPAIKNYCVPDSWEDFFVEELAVAESGTATNDDADGEDEDASTTAGSESPSADQGGGCSVARGNRSAGGWAWFMLLSAPLFLRRRRSA